MVFSALLGDYWREREAFGLLSPKKALAVASNNSLKGRSQPQVREHEGENSQQYRLVVKFFFSQPHRFVVKVFRVRLDSGLKKTRLTLFFHF